MCLNGNSAELSVHYINAQLQALFDNATKCAEHVAGLKLDFKSSAYEKSRYKRALREFHYLPRRAPPGLKKEELFFHATFAQPKFQFVCNHTVFFALKIEAGRVNVRTKEAAKPGSKASAYVVFNRCKIPFLCIDEKDAGIRA